MSDRKQPRGVRRQDNPLGGGERSSSNHYSWRGRSTLQTPRRQRDNAATFDAADRGSVGRRSHPAKTLLSPSKTCNIQHLGFFPMAFSPFASRAGNVISVHRGGSGRRPGHLPRYFTPSADPRTADRYVGPAPYPTMRRVHASMLVLAGLSTNTPPTSCTTVTLPGALRRGKLCFNTGWPFRLERRQRRNDGRPDIAVSAHLAPHGHVLAGRMEGWKEEWMDGWMDG